MWPQSENSSETSLLLLLESLTFPSRSFSHPGWTSNCQRHSAVTHSLSPDVIDSHSEISMFYRKCFNSIYQRHPRMMENIPLPWPSPSDLEQLVDLSRGSLLFALKIVNFVTNGNQLPSTPTRTSRPRIDIFRSYGESRKNLSKDEPTLAKRGRVLLVNEILTTPL